VGHDKLQKKKTWKKGKKPGKEGGVREAERDEKGKKRRYDERHASTRKNIRKREHCTKNGKIFLTLRSWEGRGGFEQWKVEKAKNSKKVEVFGWNSLEKGRGKGVGKEETNTKQGPERKKAVHEDKIRNTNETRKKTSKENHLRQGEKERGHESGNTPERHSISNDKGSEVTKTTRGLENKKE